MVKERKITSLKHSLRNSLAICLLSYSNCCAKLSALTKCPEWLLSCCSQFNICEVFSIAPTRYICTSLILCHSLLEPEGWLFPSINRDMSKIILPTSSVYIPRNVASICLSCILTVSDINLGR